jgi:hypothetical protein
LTKPITNAELAELDDILSDQEVQDSSGRTFYYESVAALRERLRLAEAVVEAVDKWDLPEVEAYRAAIQGDK